MGHGSQVGCLNEAQMPLANGTMKQPQQGKSPYGNVIRDARKAKGWEREHLAKLYGEFFRDDQVSEDTIRMWEDYNKVPKNPKRRHILAALLGISPLLLGLEPLGNALLVLENGGIENALKEDSLDIAEYRRALIAYTRKHHIGTAIDTIKKIKSRIYRLTEKALFSNTSDKRQIEQLLCGYLACMGNIARDHQHFKIAIGYLDKAVSLAAEKNDEALHATALIRRGGAYADWGEFELSHGNTQNADAYFTASVHDHDQALQLRSHIPPQLRGSVLAGTGCTYARVAQDQHDMTHILSLLDEAESLVGQDNGEENIEVGGYSYLLRLYKERFYLNKASVFLRPPIKELRLPARVGEALAEIPIPIGPHSTRNEGYNILLQAQAEFELGNYPFAATLASDALETLKDLYSDFNIARVATLHANLSSTSFGNSLAVAELGAQLVRVQHPEMF